MSIVQTSLEHLSPVWSRSEVLRVDRGEGVHLITKDGTRYMDFTTGIGVTNTGHAHPRVVEAVQEQAAKLLHGQLNIVIHDPVLNLISELREVMPHQLDGYFFSNSGAEAVEGAMKLARAVTGRTNVIVFHGSFHGRTVGTMSLTTSKTIYRAGYQPLMPGVFVAPFPYAHRYGWEPEETCDWCLDELRFLLKTQTAPEETAAMIIEPVLGEGGYVPLPAGFLEGLREICDEYGIMLIVDEIQSGFGRTGEWFGFDHFDVVPDIVTLAKGLASGLPLSGVIAPMEYMEKWPVGSHGGTYGGNVVASAAAVATIQTIRDEKLVHNARILGQQLTDDLLVIQQQHPIISDVRGPGLMIGVEFKEADGKPAGDIAKKITKACRDEHLLLLTCGPYGNVIRFIPPLIVTEEQITVALAIFERAVASSI